MWGGGEKMKKQKNWPVANLDEIIFSSSFTEVVRKEGGREWILKNTKFHSLDLLSFQPEGEIMPVTYPTTFL